MVAPLIPIVIGAGMAAAGGGTAAKGFSTGGTKPNRSYYGGSRDAYMETQDQYARAQRDSVRQMNSGMEGLAGVGNWGAGQVTAHDASIDAALANDARARAMQAGQVANVTNAAMAYDPGAQSMATYRAALAEAGNANLGMAQGGSNSALALRNALNANAQAGVDIGQRAALIRAQEEQAKAQLGIQAGQAAAGIAGNLRGGDQALAGMQVGRQQFGAQTAGNVYSGLTQLGAQREGTYLGAQQNMEMAQLEANMDYDRRRAEERQQKRQMLVSLGAGLIGGGGNMMASGMGGGK